MFCSQCGNKLPDGAKFCGRCGQKVVNRTPEPAREAPVPERIPFAVPSDVSPRLIRSDGIQAEAPAEEPVFEKPAYEEPTVGEPLFEAPAEEPAVETPAEEPAVEPPVSQPVFAPHAFERPMFRDPIPEEAPVYTPPQPEQPVNTPPQPEQPVYTPPQANELRFERRTPEPPAPEAVPYKRNQPVQPVREEPADEPAFLPEKEPEIPRENKALSPWAYFGYSLLFAIPVIGWILLVVFSFIPKNVNLKNFARSYWLWAIVLLAITLVVLILIMTGVLRGPIETAIGWLKDTGLNWVGEHLAQ